MPRLHRHGTFNMLLSNGQALWAHCSTHLHYVVREHPFGAPVLADKDLMVDFEAHAGPGDRVAIVATEPLTRHEPWQAMSPGQLLTFRAGTVAARQCTTMVR
jgi:glutamine amidotransferase